MKRDWGLAQKQEFVKMANDSFRSLQFATEEQLAREIETIASKIPASAQEFRRIADSLAIAIAGDSHLIQAAVLALVLDEISYSPDASARQSRIANVNAAASRLGLSQAAVLQLSRKAPEIRSVLERSSG